MTEIQPGLIYLTRADWGARTDIPRLGHPVNRLGRTEAIMHHTVIIDNDATPNRWETLAEVKAKMVQLQTIRPDLGLDVPYNDVAFHMEDGSLVICEGRGFDRTGAHTHAHNTRGTATAGQGNFNLGQGLNPYVDHWSRWWGYQKYDMGMENLGSVHPARGIAFGHIDLAATSCPGDNLYAIIPQLEFKEDKMDDAEFLARLEKLLTQARIPATLEDGKTPRSGAHALGMWLDASRLHHEDAAKHSAGEGH
ncbi:hypothetical protein LCGC14_2813350, partial [marine sediment metagenome]